MDDIYLYNSYFDKNAIIDRVNTIAEAIEEERHKENRDLNREKELIYAQFIQGLRLSTNNNNIFNFF